MSIFGLSCESPSEMVMFQSSFPLLTVRVSLMKGTDFYYIDSLDLINPLLTKNCDSVIQILRKIKVSTKKTFTFKT